MNLYEKRLAQLERKTAKIKYILTRIPITDTAKKAFGMYEFSNREMRDPNFRILKAIRERNKEENSTKFEYVFYYDDPKESEKKREEIVLQHSIDTFNRFKNHKLQYGIDYEIIIQKIIP